MNAAEECEAVLEEAQQKLQAKIFNEPPEKPQTDLLMDVFKMTPEMKHNPQFTNRHLGATLEKMLKKWFEAHKPQDFQAPERDDDGGEPYDLLVGDQAIDVKYRVGSGDSGSIKKWKRYAKDLKAKGYKPVWVVLRDDKSSQHHPSL